ncbi:MAG: hypothetical protein JSR99_06185 [Proteobacteria bacterium]|nr:hypothetical protein [Pseudomonadota bacterium]
MTTFIWRFRSWRRRNPQLLRISGFNLVPLGGAGTWLIAAALSNPWLFHLGL